jgi:hypothetical protein
MTVCAAHVRFQGQSGHDLLRESAFPVAIGVKRTWAVAPHMSAFDPKRTSAGVVRGPSRCAKFEPTQCLSSASGEEMRRREFIIWVWGAVSWPIAARAHLISFRRAVFHCGSAWR